MQLDVFTLVPHAFAWLTEQRPLASVLGGELPAMVVVDALARLLPGATGSEESPRIESFSAELEGGLEYPHYTRPHEFRGWHAPDVLLSGHHAQIEEWRRNQSRLRSAP